MLETGTDQILCPGSIDFEVAFLLDGFGDARKMKDVIGILHGLCQGGFVATIPGSDLDGEAFKPLQIAPLSHEAADLDSSIKKRLGEMASNKSCPSCH
jgi:hypothetical protein